MSLTKPIQEQIFKSRLTITYRTNITGTVQQERLPYRLLVLGEFEGSARREAGLLPDLAKRNVRSIKRGTTVDDHLSEIVPIWRIPTDGALEHLSSKIPGKVGFDQVLCNVPAGAIQRNESKKFALTGSVSFESTLDENGLATISGSLKVGGTISVKITDGVPAAQDAEMFLTGAISGDYIDPATDKVLGVITAYVSDKVLVPGSDLKMVPKSEDEDDDGSSADAKVKPFVVTVAAARPLLAERTVPFQSMDGFMPDAIAASVPELRRLQVIKQLLLDLQSGLRNRPELRKEMKSFLPGYGAPKTEIDKKLVPFEGLKSWAEESYPLLKIDHETGAGKNGNGGGNGSGNGGGKADPGKPDPGGKADPGVQGGGGGGKADPGKPDPGGKGT